VTYLSFNKNLQTESETMINGQTSMGCVSVISLGLTLESQ